MTEGATQVDQGDPLDPRRWVVLAIALTATMIVVLDNTVLTVAIPTIMRDFHTTLPSLQWVLTGYALTFATFLIIGGRLGDLYGHRRTFIIGAAMFGAGSLLASQSWNVPSLVLGEALIEGMGASLMLPATLAILSTTFKGKERATAFGAWGAVTGSAAGLGPVLGGWLTSDFSWRWSFGINVIIAPLAIVGVLLFMPRPGPRKAPEPLDWPGALLIALGMFLVVFALTEGGTYGWITPIRGFTILGAGLWPAGAPIAITPVAFVAGLLALRAFYGVERRRERDQRGPLFEFALLQHRTFRYGLLTAATVQMGQFGLGYGLALFLQEGKRLSALQNGLWVLPLGLGVLLMAPVGGWLTHRIGIPAVIRLGLIGLLGGLLWISFSLTPGLAYWRIVPGLVAAGIGAGWVFPQLNNLTLSDVPPAKTGVASGTNVAVRQVGAALGVAVIGALVTTQTVIHAVHRVNRSTTLAPGVRALANRQIHALATGFRPHGLPPAATTELDHIMMNAVSVGTRDALLFATGAMFIGLCFSMGLRPTSHHERPADLGLAEDLAALAPVVPGHDVVDTQELGSRPV